MDNLLSKLAVEVLTHKEIFDSNYDNKYDPGFIDNVTHIKWTEKIKTDDKEEYYYYNITATPGHKYIEINKMLDYYAGFSTKRKWYIRWNGI